MEDDSTPLGIEPLAQARELIAQLGFDGAQAEAEQAANRARYFELFELEVYWSDVAENVLLLNRKKH